VESALVLHKSFKDTNQWEKIKKILTLVNLQGGSSMKFYLFVMALFLNAARLNAKDIDVTQPLRISQLIPREGL